MIPRASRTLITASIIGGVALFAAGAWSCVASLSYNLGPFSLTEATSLRVHRGVVAVRQVTGYEQPVTLADWENIDHVAHPERITPPQPNFPWFGFFDDRQMGIVDGSNPGLEHRGAPNALVTPAKLRVIYFPIWLPAMLLCTPLVRSRNRGNGGAPRFMPAIAG